MKPHLRLALSMLCIAPGFARAGLASDTVDFGAYVPEGWVLLQRAQGDLNADGRDDAVLVLEKNDPLNRRRHSGLGANELNLNPRRLLILFQTPDGYRSMLSTDRFLPPEGDEQSPCLADPLGEGGVRIARNTLRISFDYWLSCGGWETSGDTYTFRYQQARFRLTGRDHRAFMRNSGEGSEYSVNYVTGAVKIIKGLNEFEPSKPKTTWQRVSASTPLYLDEITPNDIPDESGG